MFCLLTPLPAICMQCPQRPERASQIPYLLVRCNVIVENCM